MRDNDESKLLQVTKPTFSDFHHRLLCRPGNLSLRTQAEEEDAGSVGGEYCHSHSAHLQDAARVAEKQADDLARIQEFKNFVLREDAKVLPVIEALLATGRYADAADRARLTNSEFTWMLTRLKKLGTCFLNGEPVPRRRRPYKRRIAKITIVSDSRFAALKA